MQASDFLLHIGIGLGTILFAWLARRPARYDAVEEARVLHYGWIFRAVVCVACLLGVTIGLSGLLISTGRPQSGRRPSPSPSSRSGAGS